MDENRYRDLVKFLVSPVLNRKWQKWITEETDSKKKKIGKTNFRAIAIGTVQGFKYRMGSFIKKFSKTDRKRPIRLQD